MFQEERAGGQGWQAPGPWGWSAWGRDREEAGAALREERQWDPGHKGLAMSSVQAGPGGWILVPVIFYRWATGGWEGTVVENAGPGSRGRTPARPLYFLGSRGFPICEMGE